MSTSWLGFRVCRIALCAALLSCCMPCWPVWASGDQLLFGVPSLRPLVRSGATVGPGGGTVSAGQLTLSVPTGAFEQPVPVQVSTSTSVPTYGLERSGPAYVLELSTDRVCQPLAVTVAGFGGADRTVNVAIADALLYEGQPELAATPAVVQAQVTGGALHLQLPASIDCAQNPASAPVRTLRGAVAPALLRVSLWPVSSARTLDSAHFRLNYRSEHVARGLVPQTVLNYAERAYGLLGGLSLQNTLVQPFVINVVDNMGQRDGELEIPLLGGSTRSYININSAICTPQTLDRLGATIGHEYYHAVQAIYDPRTALRQRNPNMGVDFLWLDEACSVFLEGRELASDTYVSPIFLGNLDSIDKGLEAATTPADAQNAGYFASGFLRYLSDTFSWGMTTGVWTYVSAQGATWPGTPYSGLRALRDAIAAENHLTKTLPVVWTEYMRKLISGTTGYAGWPLPMTHKQWYVSSGAGATMSYDFPAFSGQKWMLTFNNQPGTYTITPTALSPHIDYALFKSTSPQGPFTPVETLGQGYPHFIDGSTGEVYLVSVVNRDTREPYNLTTTAGLRITPASDCLCPGAPPNGSFSTYYDPAAFAYTREWFTGSGQDRIVYAQERYLNQGLTLLTRLECYWPDSGKRQSMADYISNVAPRHMWSFIPYDTSGRIHGDSLRYYEDASLLERTPYVEGLRHGVWESFWQSGAPRYTGNYVNDQRHGPFRSYGQDGTLLADCTWTDNQLTSGPTPECLSF